MSTLLSDPEVVPPESQAIPCATCGAPMEPDQDWCLACGTARAGRLGGKPGGRTAAIAAGVTLLLVIGALSAGYAALTHDAGQDASSPAAGDATPIAQAQPDIAPPAPAVGPTPAGPSGVTGAIGPIPTTPSTSSPTRPPTLPPLPPTTSPPATSSPTVTPTTTTTKPTPSKTTSTSTTTTPTLTPITLGADEADLYDPYGRQAGKGDPANSYDDNAKDPWFVTTAADGKPMNVGLLVNLETPHTLKQIRFATDTPGFRVEVYTTDGSAVPDDILDTRWTHVTDRSKVDQNSQGTNKPKDGKEIIRLSGNGVRARQLLLWFTVAPAAGPTVNLRDLALFG